MWKNLKRAYPARKSVYGWGDGQWMRDWEERMKAAGAEIVGGEGVICMEAPDDEAIAACEKLGSQLI